MRTEIRYVLGEVTAWMTIHTHLVYIRKKEV
jgi:hypothetical protein